MSTCLNCNKSLKNLQKKFCSLSCYYNYNRCTGGSLKGKSYEERYGIDRALEIKKKIKDSLTGEKGYWFGKKGKESPNFGKHASEETRKKNSAVRMGKYSVMKGKSYEELYGIEKAGEIRKKQRIGRILQIEINSGICWPNYNKEAVEFFKSFDESHNTQGKYAVYGGGEFYIKELGYWLDYFNIELKLIMEYDEKHHFDGNGNIREKDIRRQAEIQAHYPDFEFRRIRST